mgnify:CR=1 FL=1
MAKIKTPAWDSSRCLIIHEKHGDRYFLVRTPEEVEKISQMIFEERQLSGNYYYEDDPFVHQVLKGKASAWLFLNSRKDHEYEELELIFFENLK